MLNKLYRAEKHLNEALKMARNNSDRRNEGRALDSVGRLCYALKKRDHAIEHHKKALEIAQEIGDRWCEGNALFDLACCYDVIGEHELAVEHAKKSLILRRQIETQQAVQVGAWLQERGMTVEG
ncbi:MAG: tetratricopeptide repeat protein [Geminicoccaceae bacterium]|nr:tetratricopeptide repeat protein [Geminicoccaceae bacterium]